MNKDKKVSKNGKTLGRKPNEKLDKVVDVKIWMKRSRAVVWPSRRINGLIDDFEANGSVGTREVGIIAPEKPKMGLDALRDIAAGAKKVPVVEKAFGETSRSLDPLTEKFDRLRREANSEGLKMITAWVDKMIEQSER